MKTRVSDLTGPALDWAVAKCEGRTDVYVADDGELAGDDWFDYSTDWAYGGPIIEREKIDVFRLHVTESTWEAGIFRTDKGKEHRHAAQESGPTPLIAAMRCYVAAKLGNDIEIPEELT